MAPEKVDVARADKAAQDRVEMLKELAKMTKPTGASAKGKAEEKSDDEDEE